MPTERESIDILLKPLAIHSSSEADALLDLRDLLRERGHPGSCVKCFFKLFGAAGSEGQPLLGPLRQWIERELEIVVSDGPRVLEVLPLEVRSGDTLERFCHRAITRIREDRAYPASRIELGFRYRSAA